MKHYWLGADAITEGAIRAGCGYFAGYPITPATEILERMATRLRENGGVFMQMEDEIGSILSVIGASWAGAKAMTATSGPGFDLMQEGMGYAVMTETPIVVVDVQRAGPATGALEAPSGDIMQAKWGSHGDYQIIAICPWSVQEAYDLTIDAFNLAEKYRVPVVMLVDAAIAHLQERMEIREDVEIFNREKEPGAGPFGKGDDGVPPMPSFGEGERVHLSGGFHNDYGLGAGMGSQLIEKLISRLDKKIMNNREKIIEYETYYTEEDMDVLIVCYGVTARSSLSAIETMRREGGKVGMLRLKTLWPFADRLIRDLGSKAKRILVPETNKGQLAGEVMKYASCDVISYGQTNGQDIYPDTIIKQLRSLV